MTFQQRVDRWLIACFGPEIARDKTERSHRFLEEALELVQACDCSRDEALQLVDYVFKRDKGEIRQEVGGVMNTLAALCLAHDIDMMDAGHIEMDRCWTKVDAIRAKQRAKPKFSPLPEPPQEKADDRELADSDESGMPYTEGKPHVGESSVTSVSSSNR